MPHPCVIFDFDGVIADTERLHLAAYNHALAHHAGKIGGPLVVSPAGYFIHYVVYSSREAFTRILFDAHRHVTVETIDHLCRIKDLHFEEQLHGFAEPLPGVRDLLAWLEARSIPRAICSGAACKEIEHLLAAFNLRHHFDVLVSIEDVSQGKPDPEGYNLAFQKLAARAAELTPPQTLHKKNALVIEDSRGGCQAAKNAGLPVLAVATSLSEEQLQLSGCADYIVGDLSHLDFGTLQKWLGL